jgi:hypothetical protein
LRVRLEELAELTGSLPRDSSFDADLNAPPDGVPAHPAVITRPQVLPFGELTWENFERLCYRIAGKAERVEYVARYGRSGQAQQGIDLYARLANGKYEVWQAKRYEAMTAGEITKIVDTFRAGTWSEKSEQLILAVQASLADTKVQDAIERETIALKAEGITFLPRGGEELSQILRDHPALVDDFFGRGWVEAFLGLGAGKQLGARLDGAEFARVRVQIRGFYDAHFHLLDVGVSLPPTGEAAPASPPSLLQRFTMPDVLVRDTIAGEPRAPKLEQSNTRSDTSAEPVASNEDRHAGTVRRRDYVRRTPLAPWLADGLHLAVVGEAGSGKSTLLRCIALDILVEGGVFPQISRRWGSLLPIHISFSRWSRLNARLGRAAGLKEIVAEVLQPALTADLMSLLDRAIDERRILLLLDGLDEWSDEQAARTTLQHILAFVATHAVPTVATARPRGLDKIGAIPAGWLIAELAPLSVDQQRSLAEVWFVRSTARASTEGTETRLPIKSRLDRFFVELTRDRRLSTLAGNPLLLVGLIALSMRHIALPRNKTQAIQSLVAILIETHPEQRATEAGDTQARFISIPDIEDRRAALGKLAFVARSVSGGGTYDIKEAKKTIREYLADPATFAYPAERAQKAAGEILAVNAETVGLLAERASGEVGFAHAMFEEFLAAEHIQGWPFSEIMSFVHDKSGEPLWRNVISNLVSLVDRPTEVQSLVATIEDARSEDAGRQRAVSRDVLLADIAFGSSRKPPATTQRLIEGAFAIIERGDWLLVRREVLKSALTSMGDTPAPTPVDDRMAKWTPRRENYLSSLFDALAGWPWTEDLYNALVGGLYDEERGNQRSAARALARLYASRADVRQRLQGTLASTLDLSVMAAALEALTIGWPETLGLSELHDRAVVSQDPTVRLVGISGRLASGRANASDRDALLGLLSDFPQIDFWDRPTARASLSEHWPNDPDLIALALEAVRRGGRRRGEFERETAMHYLVRCSASIPPIADWVREELQDKYPFSMAHDEIWDCIAPFVAEHSDIRAAVINVIKSERGRHSLHDFQSLIVAIGGDELRDALIEIASVEQGWGEYWAVRPLLQGWGRADATVATFLDGMASWDDKRLDNLAALLPEIITDSEVCRARLLSLVRHSERPRFDLIARGFAALGCGADDSEVVDVLLAAVGKGAPAFDPGPALLAHFSANPRVRQYALDALMDRAPPLAALALAYGDDAEIRRLVLRFANSLQVTLRGDIAEVASGEASVRPCFHTVFEGYDLEVDGELKIAASIYYHRHLARGSVGPSPEHLAKLATDLHAVGPDLHERRAAAFAGMLLLGRVNDIVPMIEYRDRFLHIRSGKGYGSESDSLMAIMAERWEDLSTAFGGDLAARFGDFGSDDGHLWDCLAPHLSASPAARRDFLNFCSQTGTTLGLRSFVALAREQPSSDLLLRHCWRVFGHEVNGQHQRQSAWAIQRIRFEIAYILRDQFRERADVAAHLQETLKRGENTAIVALSLFSPREPLLDQIRIGPLEIAQQYSDWVVALHLAAARSDAKDFFTVTSAMINRPLHGVWDFQEVTNRAVVERLRRDSDAVRLVKDRLAGSPSGSEIASLPRYLSAAGALDEEVNQRCACLLTQEAREPLPRAAYDAIDDTIRAVSQSLLEVVTPSLSP